jgi:hypothetical protein
MVKKGSLDIVVRKDGSFIPKEVRASLVLGETDEVRTLVIPGIAQDGRIPGRIAKLVPGTDVASAFPYWEVPATSESLNAFATAYPLAAVETWREAYGDEESVLTPNVVAESEATMGTVRAEQLRPDYFGHVAYLKGFGLGIDHLGVTPDERVRHLGMRAIETALQWDQSPIYDRWNMYAGGRVLRRLGRIGAMEQIKLGLGINVLPTLIERAPLRHAEGKRTALIAGSRDKMTLHEEQEAAQAIVGSGYLDLITIDASHSSMATRGGARGLQQAVDYITRTDSQTKSE